MMSSGTSSRSPGSDRLLVIVPCLNEEHNVRSTVEEILRTAVDIPMNVEVMLIDDGSTDATRDEMESLRREHGVCTMYHDANRGVGRCLLLAYATLDPQTWVTIMPGDNEIDFRSILNFVEIRERYDLILGYLQNPVIRPVGRRIASWAYMRTVTAIYGFGCRYLNGMKLFRAGVFSNIDVKSSGHAFNAELLAKAMLKNPHLRIGEAPFVAKGRPLGASKAIHPRAIARAAYEVGLGWHSVTEYRQQVVRQHARRAEA